MCRVQEVRFEVKNRRLLMRKETDDLVQHGKGELIEYGGHSILVAALKNNETFRLDLTGAQFLLVYLHFAPILLSSLLTSA